MAENFSNIKNNSKIRSLFKKNFSKDHLIILGANTVKKYNQEEEYFNSMILIDSNFDIIAPVSYTHLTLPTSDLV